MYDCKKMTNIRYVRLLHNSLGFLVLNCLFFHCPIFYGLHQRKPLSLLPKKKSCIYTDRVTGREIGVEKKQSSMVHTKLHISTTWYTCGEKTVLNGIHKPPHHYTMVHMWRKKQCSLVFTRLHMSTPWYTYVHVEPRLGVILPKIYPGLHFR